MSILQTLFTDIQNPYPEEILTQLSLKTKKSVIRFVLQTIFLTFKNNKKPLLNPHPNPNPSKNLSPTPTPKSNPNYIPNNNYYCLHIFLLKV